VNNKSVKGVTHNKISFVDGLYKLPINKFYTYFKGGMQILFPVRCVTDVSRDTPLKVDVRKCCISLYKGNIIFFDCVSSHGP
jgi:hypothetical protein